MNIREAKEEIIRTIKAYTAVDEDDQPVIPISAQRPLLLMGPPGIGKTAVMEQASKACGVGLLSYTITHHTRQSAVGLPELVHRTYGEKEYTVTQYTMSEIIGSVYEYMERTGHKKGILFIDEINCVSETLAPTILQFLQFKTFGTHKVPDGWIIAAAGNPSEYNASVRELDMAALDRVRLIHVEADFGVWETYAQKRQVHPAILSYLAMHPESFYRVELTREKRQFVTARGWEDLSRTLKEYERQELQVTDAFMEEFLRCPQIAADFSTYYRLYQATAGAWKIPEYLKGTLTAKERAALLEQWKNAGTEERCMAVRHLLAAASRWMSDLGRESRYLKREKEVLEQLVMAAGTRTSAEFFADREQARRIKKEHGILESWEEKLEIHVDRELKDCLLGRQMTGQQTSEQIRKEQDGLEAKREELVRALTRTTEDLKSVFGEDLELADWLGGIREQGDYEWCGFDASGYDPLMIEKRLEQQVKRQMAEMEEHYETDDRI